MECNHLEHRTNTKIKTKRQTCLARLQARELTPPAHTYYLIKKFKMFWGARAPTCPLPLPLSSSESLLDLKLAQTHIILYLIFIK